MREFNIVNQSDLSCCDFEKAISLYMANWGEIIKSELEIASDAKLREQLETDHIIRNAIFPEGQKAVINCETGMHAGTINSLLYDSQEFSMIRGWNQLTGEGTHGTHRDYGDSLICVAIQTSEQGAGRKLVEAQADLAKILHKNLFVFTRPNGYAAYLQANPGVTIDLYLELVVNGRLEIPGDGVSFHNHIGAVLAPLLNGGRPYFQNSRPGDASSMTYNVLMQYRL